MYFLSHLEATSPNSGYQLDWISQEVQRQSNTCCWGTGSPRDSWPFAHLQAYPSLPVTHASLSSVFLSSVDSWPFAHLQANLSLPVTHTSLTVFTFPLFCGDTCHGTSGLH